MPLTAHLERNHPWRRRVLGTKRSPGPLRLPACRTGFSAPV